MTDTLGPLYHWSPRERLGGITRLGLVPGKRNIGGAVLHGTDCDGNPIVDENGSPEFRQPGVCLAPSPVGAWDYSHGAWRSVGTFDLWQVTLEPADAVHILEQWGAHIREVRVHNRIPKRRIVWIGERTVQ